MNKLKNDERDLNKLKNDEWILRVKNEKNDFGFAVSLKMDDPRHQEIYGFVVDEVTKILKKTEFWKQEEN